MGDAAKKTSKSLKVMGRGDLHLGILFEKMRREGMEFMVSPPEIIMKTMGNVIHEPIERITIEVDEVYEKSIIEKFQSRKSTLVSTDKIIKGNRATVRIAFDLPARGFIGCRAEILSETRGTAIIRSEFLRYE